MTVVSSSNDFTRLEEIIIGDARGLRIPPADISLEHFFEPPPGYANEHVSSVDLERTIAETNEDLQTLEDTLVDLGVRVRRPRPFDHDMGISVGGWTTTSMHSLMPRDCLLIIDSTIIEVPMATRARYCETFPLRDLLREYFDAGATWIAAPKPRLPDNTYQFDAIGPTLAENEPLFDAANLIRCGRDIFFNVSNSGNRLGMEWLRRVLGDTFTFHEMSLCADHVGTTLQVLRPGLLLASAERLDARTLPEPLQKWKILWFEDPRDQGFGLSWARASPWVGMNIISVDEHTVIVSKEQESLARLLEKEGFTVIPVPFRHGRTFGGGFHCCSLDVRRQGSLESFL